MNNQDPICDSNISDEEIKRLLSPNTSNFQDPSCYTGGDGGGFGGGDGGGFGGGGGILNKDNLFSYVNSLTSPFTNINDIKPFLCEVMRVAGLDPSIVDNIDPVLHQDPESSLQEYQDKLLNFEALKCTGDPRLSMGHYLEKMMGDFLPIAAAQVEMIRSGQGLANPLTSEYLEKKAVDYVQGVFTNKTKRFTDYIISISTPLLVDEKIKAIENAKKDPSFYLKNEDGSFQINPFPVTYVGWERYAVGHEIGEPVPLCNTLEHYVYAFYVKIEHFTETSDARTGRVMAKKSNHPSPERKYFRYYVDQKDLVAKNLNVPLKTTKERAFENGDHLMAMGTYSIPDY
jgi:hypothetical protein